MTRFGVATQSFDALEMFRVLSERDVRFVTVGGIAVQAHGGNRMTRDLDIVVATSSDNLDQLAAALARLDARILGPEDQRSTEVPSASMLAASDQWHLVTIHGRLDVLTLPAHLGSFEEVRNRAIEVPLGDLIIPIAHLDDLIKMKRAAGRPQDLADVELLESFAGDN